jgi:hypothetical protein
MKMLAVALTAGLPAAADKPFVANVSSELSGACQRADGGHQGAHKKEWFEGIIALAHNRKK